MPLPQPGGRPFYNRYVVWGDKKSAKETLEEVKTKAKCAILCSNPHKPKFNFISDDKVHNCTHVCIIDNKWAATKNPSIKHYAFHFRIGIIYFV